jgi:hypothetical protein
MTDKQVKSLADPALARTVQTFPADTSGGPGGSFTLYLASVADTIPAWGMDVIRRDMELRKFWPTESMLASAIYGVAAANAAFSWELTGPDQTRDAVQTMLNSASLGKGWQHFIIQVSLDLLTQDNGAFVEMIRAGNSPTAAVIGIAHLDSAACQRTGNPEFPVIYTDLKGYRHKMPWYSIISIEEMPSPDQKMFGVQLCAVSRVLKWAQILRDIQTYKSEKIGGRFERAIHIVGGPQKSELDDIRKRAEEQADNLGLTRYVLPIILTSMNPDKPVSHVQIDLAALPDGFDIDTEMKWYINQLALGFGRDYQDFAPLPGGNLGTSAQSEVLAEKGRAKGPALFMKLIEHKFNFWGVLPQNVEFAFKEQDLEQETKQATVRKTRAEARKTRLDSGELTPQVARDIALEEGDLSQEQYDALTAEVAAIQEQDAADAAARLDALNNPPAEGGESTLDAEKPPSQTPGTNTEPIEDGEPQGKGLGGIIVSLRKAFSRGTSQAKAETAKGIALEAIRALAEKSQAPAPVIHIPVSPAPIVNIPAPIVNIPEAKAPVVHVAAPPPTPAPIVNVITPEPKDEVIEVLERDAQGRIKKARKSRVS